MQIILSVFLAQVVFADNEAAVDLSHLLQEIREMREDLDEIKKCLGVRRSKGDFEKIASYVRKCMQNNQRISPEIMRRISSPTLGTDRGEWLGLVSEIMSHSESYNKDSIVDLENVIDFGKRCEDFCLKQKWAELPYVRVKILRLILVQLALHAKFGRTEEVKNCFVKARALLVLIQKDLAVLGKNADPQLIKEVKEFCHILHMRNI